MFVWPWLPYPQATARPSRVTARLCHPPAATATTLPNESVPRALPKESSPQPTMGAVDAAAGGEAIQGETTRQVPSSTERNRSAARDLGRHMASIRILIFIRSNPAGNKSKLRLERRATSE